KKQMILGKGIFLLDTTIITLPDNTNYERAEYLPLDPADIKTGPCKYCAAFKYARKFVERIFLAQL
ncbi:unnamed protein product, partial [marine sediment metagenome]